MKKRNILKYRGYTTAIEYSAEDAVLHGKVEGINDFVSFESVSASGIVEEFHRCVDEYIAICKHKGKDPDKPCSGSFNVRISPELHAMLARKARINGRTLNYEVETAIYRYVKGW